MGDVVSLANATAPKVTLRMAELRAGEACTLRIPTLGSVLSTRHWRERRRRGVNPVGVEVDNEQ